MTRHIAIIRISVFIGLCFAVIFWWIHAPLIARESPSRNLELNIPAGTSVKRVADLVAKATGANRFLLELWLRGANFVSTQNSPIRAGVYSIERELTPLGLLHKLVAGEQLSFSVTIVEGWTFTEMRAAIDSSDNLIHSTSAMSDQQLMRELGKSNVLPEGRFFPSTYIYTKNSSDMAIYKQASEALNKRLQTVWERRLKSLPLKNPNELLTLASIIEKETGKPDDRAEIAGVFVNRLRKGMLLQTDPTVIYGMGERFKRQKGNIRQVDLAFDTDYNTYTRAGLPPGPIALVGMASLNAAACPKETDALYFVARGDGSSEFSSTLAQHNRAVRRFILNKK